jgi:mechanosensitive ion channel-like protein
VDAVNITESFNDALRAVITFLPKFAVFLVILLIGWLIAKALRKLVDVALERVGFDRAVERGGVKRALAQSRYDASGLIATLVYYAVLLITLQFAFGVFGPNPVSDLLADIVGWLPRAIVAIVIVVVAAAVANALRDLIGGALGGLAYGQLVARIVQVFIIALGVIAALNQIGVATAVTTPVLVAVLATVGGVIVVGVGGGLIRPMQQRWARWLDRAENEFPGARTRDEAYQRGREDAMLAHEQQSTQSSGSTAAQPMTTGERPPQMSADPGSGEIPPPASSPGYRS